MLITDDIDGCEADEVCWLSARLRGFGPLGLLAIVVIFAAQILAPLGAVLALVWARVSHTPWRKIGFVRPQNWVVSTAVGLIAGVSFKVIMKSLVMPLLGSDPINHTYHFLGGNRSAVMTFIPVIIIKAGFGEETFFRGYLFERLGQLLGQSTVAKVITVLLTSMLFGLLHYDQGISGIEQALITGLVFGTIFAITGELWMLMCIHTAFDLTAIGTIYWQLEGKLAHLFFN